MKLTCCVWFFLFSISCLSGNGAAMWSREYPPLVPFFRFLTLAKSVNQNGVNNQRSVTSDDTSSSEDDQTIFELADLPPNSWYSSLGHGSGRVSRLPYGSQSDTEKGKPYFDSLGRSEVHGFKRSVDKYGLGRRKTQREYLNEPRIKTVVRHEYGSSVRIKRNAVEITGPLSHYSTLEAEGEHGLQKRSLGSLGGYQVLGWKRDLGGGQIHEWKGGLDSLGGDQVHEWKRGLDSLGGHQFHGWKLGLEGFGGYQVHGWKRGLDNLGGYQVHGWKRGLESLDGYKDQGLKQDSEKRSLDPMGEFQVHGWKRRSIRSINGNQFNNQDILSTQNTKSEETGFINPSGRALDSGENDSGDNKIQLSNIVNGQTKRETKINMADSVSSSSSIKNSNTADGLYNKKRFDSLGGIEVHGRKREQKRGLDSLGGYPVHGWKRDKEEIRDLDSGGYELYGWKRDEAKRTFDSVSGPYDINGGYGPSGSSVCE